MSAFFLSWVTAKCRGFLLARFSHFKPFLAIHRGLRRCNSYPGAYVSKNDTTRSSFFTNERIGTAFFGPLKLILIDFFWAWRSMTDASDIKQQTVHIDVRKSLCFLLLLKFNSPLFNLFWFVPGSTGWPNCVFWSIE